MVFLVAMTMVVIMMVKMVMMVMVRMVMVTDDGDGDDDDGDDEMVTVKVCVRHTGHMWPHSVLTTALGGEHGSPPFLQMERSRLTANSRGSGSRTGIGVMTEPTVHEPVTDLGVGSSSCARFLRLPLPRRWPASMGRDGLMFRWVALPFRQLWGCDISCVELKTPHVITVAAQHPARTALRAGGGSSPATLVLLFAGLMSSVFSAPLGLYSRCHCGIRAHIRRADAPVRVSPLSRSSRWPFGINNV